MKVYLAGAITGLAYGETMTWRNLAAQNFREGITAVSPMRGKDYLKNESEIKSEYSSPLSSSKGIMTRDRWDVMSCDLVLVNLLNAEKVSLGTVMEIAWADAFRKPIVLIMEESGNLHDHPMIREAAGFIVHTLDEAVRLINKIAY